MAENKKRTIFQNLGNALFYGFDKNIQNQQKKIHSYTINNDKPILKTTDKDEFERTKEQLKQQKYLSSQWVKAGANLSQTTALVSNNLKLMYRDSDLMDGYPEIGAALDLYSEETCTNNTKGQLLNITSSSERVKKILDDLFVNRLDIHVNLPMWTRTMCKYGNAFALLNIDEKNGIIGARQLPTYEIERVENGVYNPYLAVPGNYNTNKDTEFVWVGQEVGMPFKSWQIAHFRLLTDSLFLPYGQSVLHKARRHFRMLTMMEDMMLIYRLERSVERRVFKIFVGNLDEADIPAYVQEIANTFKRTPIIDPETGQLDVRKNMIDATQDYFIPTKDMNAPTPIDTLPAASNLDKIEDLKYFQNKLAIALRIPSEFLNFGESVGDGKNLALKDIRFTRTINRIQQALIMELTKIAVIHLYLNGFTDELTNFKITMNNPSTQSEILKLEELSKKIGLVTAAVQDLGNGMQIMSLTRALKEILGWSDAEITQNLLELRMEKAIATELEKTNQIIKRTGLFDDIDKLYGEPNAEYVSSEMGDDDTGGGMGGGIGGSPSMDSDIGSLDNEDIDIPKGNDEPINSDDKESKMESVENKINKLLLENKENLIKTNIKRKNNYIKYLNNRKIKETINEEIVPIINKAFLKNEETNEMIRILENKMKNS